MFFYPWPGLTLHTPSEVLKSVCHSFRAKHLWEVPLKTFTLTTGYIQAICIALPHLYTHRSTHRHAHKGSKWVVCLLRQRRVECEVCIRSHSVSLVQ